MQDNPADQPRATNEIQIAAVLDLGGSGEGPPGVETMVDPIAIPILWEWVGGGAPAAGPTQAGPTQAGPAQAGPRPPHTNVTGARRES